MPLLLTTTLCSAALCGTATASDVLYPTWFTPAWPELLERGQVSASADGNWVLVSRPSSIDVVYAGFPNMPYSFPVAYARLDFPRGKTTAGCLAPDGKSLYYSLQSKGVFSYDLATRTATKLPITIDAYNRLAISPDGSKLGLLRQGKDGTNTSTTFARIYDLKNKKDLASFDLHGAGEIAFAGNTKLLARGAAMTAYNLQGSELSHLDNAPDTYSLASDGSRAYFARRADGKFIVESYSLPGFARQWSTERPYDADPNASPRLWVSVHEESKLVLAGAVGGPDLVAMYTASQGAVKSYSTAPAAQPGVDRVFALPGLYQPRLLVGYNLTTTDPLKIPYWDTWMYDMNPVRLSRNLAFPGYRPSNLTAIAVPYQGLVSRAGSHAASLLFDFQSPPSYIPATDGGKYAISPDGVYYAYAANGKMRIYRRDTGALAAIRPVSAGTQVSSWTADGRLAFSSPNQVDVFDLNGAGLNPVCTIDRPEGSKPAVLSPDGTLIALVCGDSTKLYRTASGELAKDISSDGATAKSISFSDNGRFGLHEVSVDGTQVTARVRVFKTSTFKVIRTLQFDAVGKSPWGILSPNALFVAMCSTYAAPTDGTVARGSIRIYRVSDGTLARQWDDQYVPEEASSATIGLDSTFLAWDMGENSGLTVAEMPAFIRPRKGTIEVVGGYSFTIQTDFTTKTTSPSQITWSSPSKYLIVPPPTKIPAGINGAGGQIHTTGPVDQPVGATVVATYEGAETVYNVRIVPVRSMRILVSPQSVTGGTTIEGTVSLYGHAGPSGVTVKLKSANTSVATVEETSVFIPSGETKGSFTIHTAPVSKRTVVGITATVDKVGTAPGYTVTKNLEVTPAG